MYEAKNNICPICGKPQDSHSPREAEECEMAEEYRHESAEQGIWGYLNR